MDRDEYLAREVMGWVLYKGFYITWWIDPSLKPYEEDSGELSMNYPGISIRRGCNIYDWHPGKSWPQTGIILDEMEKDFYMTVTQYWDYDNTGSEVVFRQWESSNCGRAMNSDLREAIVTAAAKAKGWDG